MKALRRLPGIEVDAIAHFSDEKARAKGEELGIERTFGDHRKFLALDELDAVHICTPNHLHYPLMSHIRAMIAAGELGEIYAVHGSYLQDWLFYDKDYGWPLEPEFSGESRAVADIGSHWMDLIEFLTGERIAEVCADLATVFETRKKPLQSTDYEQISIGTEDYAAVRAGAPGKEGSYPTFADEIAGAGAVRDYSSEQQEAGLAAGRGVMEGSPLSDNSLAQKALYP